MKRAARSPEAALILSPHLPHFSRASESHAVGGLETTNALQSFPP
jgi:hypothetical protein